jgi:ubiquinone/menaquinone biosynthesis C-methylase UbiE
VQDFRNLDRQEWHRRYLEQVGWTEHLRQYILDKISLDPDDSILEVGSGTGAMLQSLLDEGYHNTVGIDLDFSSVIFSKNQQQNDFQIIGDGHHLPFVSGKFAVSLCHFLLMWTPHPEQVLNEMQRVTRSGGWVLALAEPDYQARIDFPPPLDLLGAFQTESLHAHGIDPCIGRKLRSLFSQTGLIEIETGILGAEWHHTEQMAIDPTEWTMLRADLEGYLSPNELTRFLQLDKQARKMGTRVLFIPTFYAFGQVP